MGWCNFAMSQRGCVQTLLQKNLWMSMPRRKDASICLDICRYVCIYLEARVFPGAPPALGRPVVGGCGALRGAVGPGFKRGPGVWGGQQQLSPVPG